MCQAQDLPQRRHRAAYLAPSAGPLHPQLDGDDQVIPLLVEVPSATGVSPVSPPSSGELLIDDYWGLNERRLTRKEKMIEALMSCYRWCIDLILVVAMCLIGCFFYDVEVRVVKSNRRRARDRRVVIRNEQSQPSHPTSLLRNPTDSGSVPHWGFV